MLSARVYVIGTLKRCHAIRRVILVRPKQTYLFLKVCESIRIFILNQWGKQMNFELTQD